MTTPPRVLVVDDERAVRTALQLHLAKRSMPVECAENAEQALNALRERAFDLVITDVRMPGPSGIELLGALRARYPELPVVVMTGQASVSDAVAAMKNGAADYVLKPLSRDELFIILDRVLEQRALRNELTQLRHQVQQQYGFENIVGASEVMRRVYEDVAAVAESSATVLLNGPTGTGKELLAHAIHYRSRRAKAPFVRVNCAAIPESLLESELFGHEKGSFSGAIRQHNGKFEQADGGTLLLDEIGETNLAMQAKLLRVLENGEFQRVGGAQTQTVDVRVIAATHRDLRKEVDAGRFREDLYYRLHVVAIRVPSLAERREDIPLLVDHFLRKYAEKNHRPPARLSADQMERLVAYPWPGNVRQLEHAVERAIVLHREGEPFDLPVPEAAPSPAAAAPTLPPRPPLTPTALASSLDASVDAYERQLILDALASAHGVQARAAALLGVSRSNLNYRIRRLGIRSQGTVYE
jgi:DNA-binding NtrC family response regulator